MTNKHPYRDFNLSQINESLIGNIVYVAGFIHTKRDHGGLLFIELRDHYERLQCVIDKSHVEFAKIEALRVESTVSINGTLEKRTDDTVNENIKLGDIELKIQSINILSEASILPFQVNEEANNPEDMRLRYRYLDLRHASLHERIIKRSQIIQSFRNKMIEQGFLEMQTPILTASSPEGARDFLVPSRMYPGKFYALPQAPQQFKQMLMIANFDKYFQIAPCFRDEDTRADRVFEFYQIDYEMAYATMEDVWAVSEYTIGKTFKEFATSGYVVDDYPFPRMTYAQAMRDYGSDKPDLRNPIKLKEVSSIFEGSQFDIFGKIVRSGGKILAIPAPKAERKSRSFFDNLNKWAQDNEMPGLGYIAFSDSEAKGPIAKKLTGQELNSLKDICDVGSGDAIFFVAGSGEKLYTNAAKSRTKVASELDIIEKNAYRFCWITDFPFFELSDDGKLDFAHNPFSMPQGDAQYLEHIFKEGSRDEKLSLKAFQYDLVCNGYEVSSGGVRNHRPDLLLSAFESVGYSREFVEDKFEGILGAYRFGAPPHAGAAPGIDRMVMLLLNEPNLREVIAFPISQKGQDLMMNAPNEATDIQLKELGLSLKINNTEKK